MRLSTFATIITILAGLFGVAFVSAPAQVSEFYGMTQDPGGLWVSRYFGGSLLFIAMIYWSYSAVSPAAKSWPKLLVYSIIFDVIQLILTLMTIFSSVGNSRLWSTVALYSILAIASVYFLGVCKKARTSSEMN